VSIVSIERARASRAAIILVAVLGVLGSILAPTTPQQASAANSPADAAAFSTGAPRQSTVQTPASTVDAALPQPAAAVSGSDFQDGYIISDQNFFDYNSMDAGSVQAFLNARVSRCVGANGQPCLKDYSTTASAIGGDTLCQGMPGGAMSAAQIIVAAARSCRISPKVLLVMLQKEQGLVTSTSPSEWNYRAALGQSCPDTAPCDSAFSGFYRQVYYGARQLQAYMRYPGSYAYRVGWNNILYHPNTGCGTKRVYIQNDATRLLYIYTPYTPNAAALNNLYGTGDGCSSYGNRNFWRFYNDWFGPTTAGAGERAIVDVYNSYGGSASWLGTPATPVVCNLRDNGCWQLYSGGPIIYTPATGAQAMKSVIHAAWGTESYENGYLGFPVTPTVCNLKESGCWQLFQGGPIIYSPATGAQPMKSVIHAAWGTENYELGWLSYPLTPTVCNIKDNGCWQLFQGGPIIYSPATGAQTMRSVVHAAWGTQGYENGWLGYPTSGSKPTSGGGYTQDFQGGTITVASSGAATFAASGPTAPYAAMANEAGTAPWLGGVNTPVVCGIVNGGCWQAFQNGVVMYSPTTGAKAVRSSVHQAWVRQGNENGWLGYPTAASQPSGGGYTQTFQGGTVAVDAAGKATFAGISSTVPQATIANRLETSGGALGGINTPVVCGIVNGGCWQAFQNGVIMYSPATGAQIVLSSIHQAWVSQQNETGWLGYPTGGTELANGGYTQTFQGGTVTINGQKAVTYSGSGATVPNGAIANALVAAPWLGGINTGVVCGIVNGGCWQAFRNGVIMYSPATGASAVRSDFHKAWVAQGNENGWMGYPTTPTICNIKDNGCWQAFQGGPIIYSPATGVQTMRSAVHAAWGTQGYENGWLGYPTSGSQASGGGFTQSFQGGTVTVDANGAATYTSSGTNTAQAAIANELRTASWLGATNTPVVCGIVRGGCWQAFQNGVIMYSPATGAKAVRSLVHQAWVSQGNENGWLGYPTGGSQPAGTGYTQTFQGGTVTVEANGSATYVRS
jgi:uncharacterized protein with LGFP repeats